MSIVEPLAALLGLSILSVGSLLFLHDYDSGGILMIIRYGAVSYLVFVGVALAAAVLLTALERYAGRLKKNQAFLELERNIHSVLPDRVLASLPRSGDDDPVLEWAWSSGLTLERGRRKSRENFLLGISDEEKLRIGEAVKHHLRKRFGRAQTFLLYAAGVSIPVPRLSNHQMMEAIARAQRSS